MDARLHRRLQRRGWDRASSAYDRFWGEQLRPVQRLVLGEAAPAAGDRVIDVACGTGALTLEVASMVGRDGRVVATDLSPQMLASAERAAQDAGAANVEFVCCGAEDLDVGGFHDVGLCSLGLMYVPDPAAALAELHRVVRPGGRVALSAWGRRDRCGFAAVFGIVDAHVTSDVCPHFFSLGSGDALRGARERAGCEDVRRTRFRTDLEHADGDEAIGAAFSGGPVALADARFDDATRRRAHGEYLTSIAEFADGAGGYRIPAEFVVASARRPA